MELIKGDLIKLAKEGKFDVIAHGCNCFCTQKSGIAKQMVEHFNTNNTVVYTKEKPETKGDISKLGNIQYGYKHNLAVVNCYTQYRYGRDKLYLDYEALTLCTRKINHVFKDKKVGLPLIGCGLAGGDKSKVLNIFVKELMDVDLTIVEL